jgi:hypothetical protein
LKDCIIRIKTDFLTKKIKLIMKRITKGLTVKSFMTLLMLACIQTILRAQEEGSGGASGSGSTTTTTKTLSTTSENWYASPLVWVIGAAVFILLLVALMRGGRDSGGSVASRTDKVTVTKSSSVD